MSYAFSFYKKQKKQEKHFFSKYFLKNNEITKTKSRTKFNNLVRKLFAIIYLEFFFVV